jgi:hypothetical protein
MSIVEYDFSDDELNFINCDSDVIQLEALGYSDCYDNECFIDIRKQDAIAIAKHFNEDRESLVEGIKEMIYKLENKTRGGVSLQALMTQHSQTDEFIGDLQKLITKEE